MEDLIVQKMAEFLEGKGVLKAILFGSRARGNESKRSDYDLIIIQETELRFFDRYDNFSGLYSITGNRLDLLIYSPDEWESISNRVFFREIMKDAKVIYVN